MENTDTDEKDGINANNERNLIDLVILNNQENEGNVKTKKEGRCKEAIGLFAYTPECFQKTFLSVYGLLFFLCCASTIQVRI